MARYELVLPKMGESVAEATIIKWTKQPGDSIDIDESVLEIATDKVDSDVPSPVAGKLVETLYRVDDVVQVGATIAIIETGGSSDSSEKTEELKDNAKAPEVSDTARLQAEEQAKPSQIPSRDETPVQ